MKVQKHFIIFMLLICIFSGSCIKDGFQANPPNTPPPPSMPAPNMINAQLIPAGNLSQARSNIRVASSGNKIVFAGGYISPGIYSSRVDIFEITTNTWTTAELSEPRKGIAVAVLGKKIYFAGGEKGIHPISFSSRVEIYDTETNEWTKTEISNKEEALLAGAAAGTKVLFAGGETAHIYDTLTNTWTNANLSQKVGDWGPSVGGITATVIDNSIYLAGGVGDLEVHNTIDIYNVTTNTWSTSFLNEYKGYAAGISAGNKNYWAGGYTYSSGRYILSDKVEIRDKNSGSSSFSNLFQGNASFSAVQKNNSIVFFTGAGTEKNKFDIYNITTGTCLTGVLREEIEGAGIISINNIIYVAGGRINGAVTSQLWNLDF